MSKKISSCGPRCRRNVRNGSEMSTIATLGLMVTGFFGGAINAVAGGATLLTFPVLMAMGLPPVAANASSSVALTPGHFFGVVSECKQLPKRDGSFWLSLAIMILGGLAGALLLFVTTDRVFAAIIPVLIGVATLTFAFGKQLKDWLKTDADHPAARLYGLIPVSLYVGYFGAGAGVVMMALFGISSNWPVRTANAMKNLFGAVANWAAIIIFAINGMIAWHETLAMLSGAVAGGLLGGRLLRYLPPQLLRILIVTAGTVMTVLYAKKYWL
jgi:uncharacterized membrane protein YfcA